MRNITTVSATAGLSLALALGLVGCGETPTTVGQTVAAPREEAVSTGGVTYDDVVAAGKVPNGLVPSGFADDLNCDALGRLIPELAGDLYVKEEYEQLDDRIVCSWTDVSLDTAKNSDVGLGITLDVTFREWWHPSLLETMCAEISEGGRITELGSTVFDGRYECAGGEIDGDRSSASGDGIWAQTPYFALGTRVTCEMSTVCRPARIDEFTDEQTLRALRTIADHVASQLRFEEPVFVSDAEEPIDFVVDWAEAGFPAAIDAPLWFCPSWESQNGRHLEYDWLYADAMNSDGSWNLAPGANDREVVIDFPATSYRILALKDMDDSRPICIESISENL